MRIKHTCMVSAVLPTPPSPSTTSLYSVIFPAILGYMCYASLQFVELELEVFECGVGGLAQKDGKRVVNFAVRSGSPP